MRYYEIAGGLRMDVSEEEYEFLKHGNEVIIEDDSLDERNKEVARKMVSRGLLNRHYDGEKLFYVPNGLADIWRI